MRNGALAMRPNWLLLLLACFTATAAHAAGERVFCCEDASGHKVCGDPLPQACYNRAYKEMSRSGVTRRDVEAPLTQEERARKALEEKAKRDAEARVAERQRRDKALLESYSSASEIESRRDLTMQGATQEINNLRRRERELVAERKSLDTRVAALKGKPAPPALREDITATDSELAALRSVIAQKTREADQIRQRFDDDRARFIELTGSTNPAR